MGNGDGANRAGDSIRVTAICGSMNPNSTTKLALAMALKGTAEFTDHTRLIELRDYKLVFVGQTDAKDYPRDIERLRAELRESQAIILGTPEYHGTLSGALKAMLDLMGPDEFEGKIVGLVGVAGGITGAIQSLNTLRTIGRNLHCLDILGLINGRPTLLAASRCVGHGECAAACPVQAITLVFGTERRGIDIPHVQGNFETNVPGLFIVGDGSGSTTKTSAASPPASRCSMWSTSRQATERPGVLVPGVKMPWNPSRIREPRLRRQATHREGGTRNGDGGPRGGR